MSPVRPTRARNPRTMALAVGGLTLGIVAVLALFVLAIPSLTEEGTVEVRLGDDRFTFGDAEAKAPTIARDGPVLFSDVGGGSRDIFVQHLGEDPNAGWYAFDARRADQPRDCTYRWDAAATQFTNPCDGTVVPADGTGLRQYLVVVDADGKVQVDLRSEPPPPGGGGTTTSTASTTTTSSLVITGNR